MKVFTTNDFNGYWPDGTAAIIIAPDEATARSLITAKLRQLGFSLQLQPSTPLLEIDITRSHLLVLQDQLDAAALP